MNRLFGIFCLGIMGVSPVTAMAKHPCVKYVQTGVVELEQPLLNEISGLARSVRNPGYFWGHTDSDGEAEIYLISRDGKVVARYRIEGEQNVDWEDIAVGPCIGDASVVCVYISDMGDNLNRRHDKRILMVKEPEYIEPEDGGKLVENVKPMSVIKIVFPAVSGREPRFVNPDVESLMVNPQDGKVYFVTKQSKGGVHELYELIRDGEGYQVKRLSSHVFSSLRGNFVKLFDGVTGADFSSDGKRYLVRTYSEVFEYSMTEKGVGGGFGHGAAIFSSSEFQGEAVTYDVDGVSVVTASEDYRVGVPTMRFYRCVREGAE